MVHVAGLNRPSASSTTRFASDSLSAGPVPMPLRAHVASTEAKGFRFFLGDLLGVLISNRFLFEQTATHCVRYVEKAFAQA
jgi:hypothetical protein